jgi:transcriptional regulator with XRE-family HTH domain
MRCPHGPYFKATTGYPEAPKTLGEQIRKRRLDLGIRQIDAAKIIGCNEMSVVNWEKGHGEPRITHLAGVVAFLGYDPFATKAVEEDNRSWAERLLAYRKARGLTQKHLARKLEIDPSTLARWERGEREPKGRFRRMVAELI